ncbi:hypothetical protein B7R54_15595 [Subtercola boreus]|uniref:Acyl-coenzyme A thioesterase THEM4 n=1 Tax=Subtercola boreus TaxID=120213 RepID=A0A3E0VLX9_9MICO|nr:PaaI family thioesterase [Subtercola boreus]RFA10468.1 hypothetical protein B7R54_15595 [Subtercola boreus]TQL56001.1 acyl-coenzyme A thioesterase PaaI-like protein [Subtercola boreus]
MQPSDLMPQPHDDLERRRAAALDLAEALRQANSAAVSTEATVEQLERAALIVRDATAALGQSVRPLTRVSEFDGFPSSSRFFSPVSGPGSPLSPPLSIRATAEGVEANRSFDRRFEGPPGLLHGGISALLFDELMGVAVLQAGHWAMTGQLSLDYRRALPLDTDLTMTVAVTSVEGRKIRVGGSIVVSSEPDTVFVTATALFIKPRESTLERYFGQMV